MCNAESSFQQPPKRRRVERVEPAPKRRKVERVELVERIERIVVERDEPALRFIPSDMHMQTSQYVREYFQNDITGKLTEVPGIIQPIADRLQCHGIANTWELMAKFMVFCGRAVPVDDEDSLAIAACDEFLKFLVKDCRILEENSQIITLVIAMKVQGGVQNAFDTTALGFEYLYDAMSASETEIE